MLEKTPESHLESRRSNQSILKKINPEYSLEGLMLKLKFEYSGHLVQRADSLEKPLCSERLRAGREVGDKMRWLDGIIDSMGMSLSKFEGTVKDRKPSLLQFMGSQRTGHD